MKDLLINSVMNNIKRYYNYDEEKLKVIKYGLASLYLHITKMFVIFLVSYILGTLKTLLILMGLYSYLRLTSFGVHAKKSTHCWISSMIIFLMIPYICENITLNIYLKIIISVISIILICIYAPADTEKRPLINKKRRTLFKLASVCNGLIYTVMLFIVRNNLLSNCILFSQLLTVFVILPITYKLFGVSYNNHKKYVKEEV